MTLFYTKAIVFENTITPTVPVLMSLRTIIYTLSIKSQSGDNWFFLNLNYDCQIVFTI